MLNAVHAILSLLAPAAVVGGAATAADAATTLDNLQEAFNGESNANARYLAFAQKADEDGYGEVASLFRAAAKAEEIHANKGVRRPAHLHVCPKGRSRSYSSLSGRVG